MLFAATCCLLVEIWPHNGNMFLCHSGEIVLFCFSKIDWSHLFQLDNFYIYWGLPPRLITLSCVITTITDQKLALLLEVEANDAKAFWGKNCKTHFLRASVNDGAWHMQLIFMFYWMGGWIIKHLCVPAGPLFRQRKKQCGGNKNPDTLKTRGMTLHTSLHSHSFVTSHTYRWIQPCLLAHENNLM